MSNKNLKFDQKQLDQAEKDFNNVYPKGIQSDIIKDLIDIAVQYIPINRSAMGGIFLQSIKDWQIHKKMELGDLIKMSPEMRIQEVVALMNLTRERLINMLALVADTSRVQQAFEKAKELYITKYAKR